MDEETISRRQARSWRAAPPPQPVGVPVQRSGPTSGAQAPSDEVLGRVMSFARITLSVIFGMLLFGIVLSYIVSRS